MQFIRGKKLKQIFADHWKPFVTKHPDLRPAIIKNVAKMLACGTEDMGFHLYQCPSCGDEKKVFHTCKSRFCPSCGIAQTKRWVEQYEVLFADTTYRHFMFHPPSEFRQYFGVGKTPYFNMLYTTVHQTLKQWYAGKKDYLPGIMAIKHTFGRDEKFTPHIFGGVTPVGKNGNIPRKKLIPLKNPGLIRRITHLIITLPVLSVPRVSWNHLNLSALVDCLEITDYFFLSYFSFAFMF